MGKEEVLEIPTVRIDGAAGTGKTFLALHEFLTVLKQGKRALFVARSLALGYFAASWAYRRLRIHMTQKQAMSTMENFWKLSQDEGGAELRMRKCQIDLKTSEIAFSSDSCPSTSFDLVIVDEAHHIYGYHDSDRDAEKFYNFVKKCCKGCKERILFSDISQSWEGCYDGAMKRFPPHKSFNMDVVIRNTERMVLGAMVRI